MDFIYTIDPESKNPRMVINKHIGCDMQDDGVGIDGAQFAAEILSLDSMGDKESITVFINSVGGSVIEGMSIYNSILECKTKVKTINSGIAASIAAVIFQAGEERIMYDYSCLMYHNPYSDSGNSDDDALKIVRESLIKMIHTRTGISEDRIGNMMNVTTWINADDSLAVGFCDSIKKSTNDNIKGIVDFKNIWKEANIELDKQLKNKNELTMKSEILKLLNLAENTTDEVVYNIIKGLVEKAPKNKMEGEDEDEKIKMENKAEDECNEDEDKIMNATHTDGGDAYGEDDSDSDASDDSDEAEDEDYKMLYENLLNEFKALKKEMDDKKNEAFENKINNLIENAIKSGRIKTDAVESFKNLAKMDFENAEKIINGLPINKKSVKIETTDDTVKIADPRFVGYKPSVAQEIMNKITKNITGKK